MKNTAKEKRIGCVFVGGDIRLATFVGISFGLFFVIKNVTQSIVMREQRKRASNACSCAYMRILASVFNTHLCKSGVCFACAKVAYL